MATVRLRRSDEPLPNRRRNSSIIGLPSSVQGRRINVETQPFHRLSSDDMTAQYLLHISLRLVSVPYAVRIDDQSRTMLTDVQTSCMVYPDPADPHRPVGTCNH